MKICIIETEFHHEVIIALVNSLSVKNWSITIITNTPCFNQLKGLQNCAILDFSNVSFNANQYFNDQYFDHIMFITVPKINAFDFLYNRSSVILHNLNYWLKPHNNIYAFSLSQKRLVYNFLKWTKYLPEILFKRNKRRSSFKTLLAPSKSLFENIRDERVAGYLDLRYPFEFNHEKTDGPIRIVVPGTINETRNYRKLLNSLSFLSTKIQQEIELTFAGVNRINMSWNDFEHDLFSIVGFNEEINQVQFSEIMRQADFGILPIYQFKSYKGILEEKGTTNISGAINDFYAYGIPALVPSFYSVDESTSLLHHYGEGLLESKIEHWILNKEFLKLKDRFLANKTALQLIITEHNSNTFINIA